MEATMATPAADRWSRIIDQQEGSGLSVRVFAKQHQLNPSTLSWWRSQLGRAKKRMKQAKTTFVEVVEVQPLRQPTLTLQLENLGVRVEVDRDTDLVHLRQVLEALC
jgi:transposase-like protein